MNKIKKLLEQDAITATERGIRLFGKDLQGLKRATITVGNEITTNSNAIIFALTMIIALSNNLDKAEEKIKKLEKS